MEERAGADEAGGDSAGGGRKAAGVRPRHGRRWSVLLWLAPPLRGSIGPWVYIHALRAWLTARDAAAQLICAVGISECPKYKPKFAFLAWLTTRDAAAQLQISA